jgi:hypothetical protein
VKGGEASKHLFCVSKAFLKISTALSNPFLEGWSGFYAFYLLLFTVSGFTYLLFQAATVGRVLAL